MNHYDIRGIANNCFSSLLQKTLQYFKVNCFNSDFAHVYRGVPGGSVLALLLFLIYTSDFRYAIKYCSVHPAQKMKFSVNDFFGKFGHIYWRNPWWKTSFLCSVTILYKFLEMTIIYWKKWINKLIKMQMTFAQISLKLKFFYLNQQETNKCFFKTDTY